MIANGKDESVYHRVLVSNYYAYLIKQFGVERARRWILVIAKFIWKPENLKRLEMRQ